MTQTLDTPNLRTLEELLQQHFSRLFLAYGAAQPPRTGLHAASLLVPDTEWCVRKHVIDALYPESRYVELAPWDAWKQSVFLNGWTLHLKWQDLFRKFGRVVRDELTGELELDRTHYDADRNVYFSPDVILEYGPDRFVVEIKGYKAEEYERLVAASEPPQAAHKQVNLYMHLTGIHLGIILVENKNNQQFKVWVVCYDREMALPYVARAYQVKGAISTRTGNPVLLKAAGIKLLPARKCATASCTLAKSCAYKDKCFEMEG